MNRRCGRFALILTAATILSLLWVGFGDRLWSRCAWAADRGSQEAGSKELAEMQDLASLQAISKAFRLVAKVARPGVVHIQVSGGTRERVSADELEKLREQLGGMLSDEQIDQLLRRRQPPGSGSGIIFDADGHILTNNHVVGGRPDITVHLNDERTYEAKLVGSDPKTDLAVIQIEAPDLHPLKFADSDQADVGEWVVAVGAPFGLTQTVTHGIISAVGRTRIDQIDIQYQNFIQTDAAINPGNSGGPLLNLRGEVLGVNTAIATQGEGVSAGVAFTIPSNMAVKVAKQLIAHGEVARGWLGITMSRKLLDQDDREILDLPNTSGVLVGAVHKDGPADQAGLLVDDVIVAVNGTAVSNSDHFRELIADMQPKERVTLRVIRDGQPRELKAQLALQPKNLAAAGNGPAAEGRELAALGLWGQALRPGATIQNYDDSERGVYVVGVDANSEREPQIRRGEVIVACNGQEVANVAQLQEALRAAGDADSVRLQVLDPSGERRVVRVKLKTNR